MPYVTTASNVTMTTCQETFVDRRWNCSSIIQAPNYTPDLTSGTREQAFVYALSSAALGHTVARACSAGTLLLCGCGHVPTGPPHGDFKWGGCADNLQYGIKYSRSFSDGPWMRKKTKKTVDGVLNRHNNRAGRRALRANLMTQCKCHGVSGSCNIKTCWKGLPRIQTIADYLKQKYYVAIEVIDHRVRRNPELLPVNSQLGMYQNDDLIYTTKSPDYCMPNPKVGSLGTLGRRCNATSDGTDSCDSMCCGRGYRRYTVEKVERYDYLGYLTFGLTKSISTKYHLTVKKENLLTVFRLVLCVYWYCRRDFIQLLTLINS
ncbi:protein Wnt-11-like [Limulus polyphemus]|uniref:Protein Wnt n=1 Tax=Limulus polyphemus TaxID=6850 RepID=A0ABM1TDX5_LIMPO|nr:protein Wnt-11-like [Limulus polyphemus]